ncbi:MAG TPA: hypothetical protein ENJ53_05415 [Phaeodactylibacter sp.]|nr:hypothetical protein [Phaeodactylibacter sp.]
MKDFDPKAFLLFALHHFDLKIKSQEGEIIELEKGYTIEIEGQNLFKLLHENQVIAPFSDLEELCKFIKQDMQLNE